jgi:hypothetical protein
MLDINPLMKSYSPLPETSSIAFYKSVPKQHKPPNPASCPTYAIVESTEDSSGEQADAGSWRGGWAKRFVPETIHYETAIQVTEMGHIAITHAPMGVNSVTTWTLRESEEGLVVDMSGEVESNKMLMAFIKTTLSESYTKLAERFLKDLKKEVEGNDGGNGVKAEEEATS